jgi:F0F1-type ATP synthase membrane subunit c/vacuolar-type H+-ATPase subunit K
MSQPSTPNYQQSPGFEPDLQPVQVTPQPVFPPPDPTAQQDIPQIQDGTWQQPAAALPAPYGANQPLSTSYPQQIGQIRSTGLAIFLFIITFGIYGLVWYYQVHDEMKRHSGQGLGGGIGLLIAIFVGFVSPFIVSAEVGQLYQQRGLQRPVSGTTGLWYLLGWIILVGPIVWFVKTNSALNAYWRSLGAN